VDNNNCFRYSFRSHISFDIMNYFIITIVGILYLLNLFCFKNYSDNTFINNYLNDLLVMCFILPYSNLLLKLYKKKKIRIDKFFQIISFSLLCGLFWEFVTPLYYKKSVTDFVDIIMYIASGLIYYIIISIIKQNKIFFKNILNLNKLFNSIYLMKRW